MADSADANSSKCSSGVLRLLLCSGSLPTHPSDQFVQPSGDQKKAEKSLKPEENVKQAAASTPGVVAKLMGLDSFPSTPLAPKERTLGAFFRSRSANSVDFLSHFDPIKLGNHHQHRRVRTSVSFSEGINDDYYTSVVLHLEEVDETAEYQEESLMRKRPDVNYEQGKKERGVRRKNNENLQEKKFTNKPRKKVEMEVQRRSVCGKLVGNATSQKKDFNGKTRLSLKERRPIIKAVDSKEELMGSKCTVKRKKNNNLAHKVHSAGCNLKKVHPEGSIPEVAQGVCSRKPLASQVANSQRPYSSSNVAHFDNGEGRAITKGKAERKSTKNRESFYYKRMAEEICRLTEEDLRQKNWMHGVVLKFEIFEEMCPQFGQEILDVLLKQFVDELVLLYATRN